MGNKEEELSVLQIEIESNEQKTEELEKENENLQKKLDEMRQSLENCENAALEGGEENRILQEQVAALTAFKQQLECPTYVPSPIPLCRAYSMNSDMSTEIPQTERGTSPDIPSRVSRGSQGFSPFSANVTPAPVQVPFRRVLQGQRYTFGSDDAFEDVLGEPPHV